MRIYVRLYEEHFSDANLCLILSAKTGVVYSVQCGGYYCEPRQIEGFLIPNLSRELAQQLIAFFEDKFAGYPPVASQDKWRRADLQTLNAIVVEIPWTLASIWTFDEQGRQNIIATADIPPLALDEERIEELTEAWVPVKTIFGPGVLIFENSD